MLPLPALKDFAEVGAVGGFPEGLESPLECGFVEEAHLETDLLEAGDPEALTVLDGTHEVGGLEQGLMGAGV